MALDDFQNPQGIHQWQNTWEEQLEGRKISFGSDITVDDTLMRIFPVFSHYPWKAAFSRAQHASQS